MRKVISCLMALCLMLVPALSLADEVNNYFWSTDTQFDLYDLGFSINLPEGWQHADEATINTMNGFTPEGEPDPNATIDNNSALSPSAIAMITNADTSVITMITCEDLENPDAVDSVDKYIELLAGDMVASGAAEGITYTYDLSTISDATLVTQTFRELAVTGSDGSVIDLLVCRSGMGSYYAFMINGTAEAITAFAGEFIGSLTEIEAVG